MSSRFRFGIATTTTSNAATPPTTAAASSSGVVPVPSFSSSSVAASPSAGHDAAPMGAPVARSGGYGGGFRRISELRNSNSIHNSSSSLGGGGHAAPAFSLATTTTPISSSSPYLASPITLAQSATTRGQSSYMTEQLPATQWAPYGGRGRADKTTPKPQRESKGRGRGRTTTRGGSRGESRTSPSSRKALPLRPDGALFDYRWYRKGGHRVLVYDGQEYKGSAAHNMWVQIKAVKGPSPGRQQARRSTSSVVGSPIEGHGSRKRARSTSSGPSRSRAAAAVVPFPSPQDLLRLAQSPSLQYFNSSFDAIMASAPSWTTILPHNVNSAAPASRDDLGDDESGFSSEQLRRAMQLSLEDMKSSSPSTGRVVGVAEKTNGGAPLLSSGQQGSDDDIETISTTCSSDLMSDGDHDKLNNSGDEAEEDDDGTDDTSSCVSIEPYVPRTDPPATIPQPPLHHQPARGPSSTLVPSASSAEYSVASNPFGGLYSVAAIPSPVTAAIVASSRPPATTALSDDRAAPLLLREPCIDSWMEEGMFVTNEFEGGYAIR